MERLRQTIELVKFRGWAFWFVLVLVMAGLFMLATRRAVDPDLFYLLAYGKLATLSGALPQQDVFAFTPTNPVWYEHQWLVGLLLYRIVNALGDWGILVVKLVLAVSAFAFLRAAQRRLCPTVGDRSLLLLFVLFTLNPAWFGNIRGLTFSAAFFALFLWLIIEFVTSRGNVRRQVSVTIAVALSLVAWVNIHAEHVLGLCAWVGVAFAELIANGVTSADPTSKPSNSAAFEKPGSATVLLFALLVPPLALLVNPWGLAFYKNYLLPTATMCASQHHVADCRGPFSQWVIAFPVFAAMLVWALSERANMPKSLWVVFVFTALLALRLERLQGYFLMTFAVLAPAFLPVAGLPRIVRRYAAGTTGNSASGARLTLAVLFLFAGVNLLMSIPRIVRNDLWEFSSFPVREFELLSKLPVDPSRNYRLLTNFEYGNYALWRLGPDFKVAIDGRYVNVYPQRTLDSVAIALNSYHPEHQRTLAELNPDFILDSKTGIQGQPELTDQSRQSGQSGQTWLSCAESQLFRLRCRAEFAPLIQQLDRSFPSLLLRPDWHR